MTTDLKKLMEEDHAPESIVNAHFDTHLNLTFFKNVISEKIANEVWIAVKTV